MSTLGRAVLACAAMLSSVAWADFSAGQFARRAAFRGALLEQGQTLRTSARLLGRVQLAISETPVASMTREQLQAEYDALDASRPGLVGPIVMLAVGGGLAIASIYFLYIGAFFAFIDAASESAVAGVATAGYVLLGLGAVLLVGGAVLLIVGGIKLASRIRERGEYGRRMDEIQEQLNTMDRGGTQGPGPSAPSAYFPRLRPHIVLARF